MKSIRWLADASLDDTGSVVGKGANLGGVSAANLPVPPGLRTDNSLTAFGSRCGRPRPTKTAPMLAANGSTRRVAPRLHARHEPMEEMAR